MTRKDSGFTLIELLAAMLVFGLVITGATMLMTTEHRSYQRQYEVATMDTNLRVAADMISDALRDAGYGVPKTNLSQWITWVPGFTSNPKITSVAGAPDTLMIATAGSQPVAQLAAAANAHATALVLTSVGQIGTGSGSLLVIGDSENAVVTAVSGTTATIDAAPGTAGLQGVAKAYPVGTPIYRVDVVTFQITTDNTGRKQLTIDRNDGSPSDSTVEGIGDLRLTTLVANKSYQLRLVADTAKLVQTSAHTPLELQTNIVLNNT